MKNISLQIRLFGTLQYLLVFCAIVNEKNSEQVDITSIYGGTIADYMNKL